MPPARRTPKQLQLDGLSTIHPNAAGMDIGAELIVVAVPPDRDPEPVRSYRTFTPDLLELVTWLVACGIDTVAMESTGVYWVAIYELLEAAGLAPYLVNARRVRMVPGRKTDWNDAQWQKHTPRTGSALGFLSPRCRDCRAPHVGALSRRGRSASFAPRQSDAAGTQGDEHPIE